MMLSYSNTVAIVGIGAIFPDAPDTDKYWEMIRSAATAVREVPEGRWNLPPDAVYDPEIGKHDHVYSKMGCFISNTPYLEELKGLDPLFHLLVTAGRRAFDDAVTTGIDLSRVGVIIGNLALPTESSSLLAHNCLGRTFEEKLLRYSSKPSDISPLNSYVAGLPAGILAGSLGLGGITTTLDAACASSLYAIKLATEELLSGRADAMLTGGVSRPDPLYTQMGFSQLRALSKRGLSAPLDASGDGLLTGEGAGIFVLKRTEDAVASGDRIYGIIRGIGLSNDIGGGLLAPISEGQVRAMRSAYSIANLKPEDIDLIECHATGTPVGDAVEISSLKELWQDAEKSDRKCVIGSVKSNIGHLLTAAGAAALTKVLLAIKNKTLPPTANFKKAQPGMEIEKTRFKILSEAEPWERRDQNIPRRAGISAFGFGGINAHLIIEEWMPDYYSNQTDSVSSIQSSLNKTANEPVAIVGMDASFGTWQGIKAVQERILGDSDRVQSKPPENWWGVQQSRWYKEQGLSHIPFNGYFMDHVSVDPGRFRIPPKEMEEMLPQQLLMLQTAANALHDAGLNKQNNQKTGIFIGIAHELNSTTYGLRWPIPQKGSEWAKQAGLKITESQLESWSEELRDAISPPLTANRTMGALGNIVASRIAREFKVGGSSFTLSSEENSGIRALETAVRMLQKGELDQALAGAVDLAGDLRAVLGHHSVKPYSASGESRPFGKEADGSIIGEGACALVLKRLSDAQRDGNRIYAIIKGIGSSNGKITESADPAYINALKRAYQEAEVKPEKVAFIEANADGTPESDRIEAASLNSFFAPSTDGSCLISSLKASIGHTGAASGLAAVLRASMALYHEIIPGSQYTGDICNELADGRLKLSPSPRYWLRNRVDGSRHAGISVSGIDGSCSHIVLEGFEEQSPAYNKERSAPLGNLTEFLFPIAAKSLPELSAELDLLFQRSRAAVEKDLAKLSSEYCGRISAKSEEAFGLAMVASDPEQLEALIEQGRQAVDSGVSTPDIHPALRDRLFFNSSPIGRDPRIAFIYPGSGNHYRDMGRELFARWPEILRQQDAENGLLKNQFQPELFWSDFDETLIRDNHRAVIFGQVATGTANSDLARNFAISPSAVIGYSLGESAALFSMRAWRDRDLMYHRMQESTLFTDDLAGECRAARKAWNLNDDEKVDWKLGVLMAPAEQVQQVISSFKRVYLLIINTPDECVIGGDSAEVNNLVSRLDCHFFPLYGVTTVHCEVVKPVASAYHDLHLFNTTPPEGVTFYSCAKQGSYQLSTEAAADSILQQALKGINYPATIEAAYNDGIRLFLEMGPGNSCSRMINRILEGRPHLARSICSGGQEPVLNLLRLLASLIAERVPLDLTPLMTEPVVEKVDTCKHPKLSLKIGGHPFKPPQMPKMEIISSPQPLETEKTDYRIDKPANPLDISDHISASSSPTSGDSLLNQFAQTQAAQIAAHMAFLDFSSGITKAMSQAITLQAALQQALGTETAPKAEKNTIHRELQNSVRKEPDCAFNRELCMEFATGSVAKMLGSRFAEVDRFPTRVRLPDEPLMLVDRIISIEGEPCSMTCGRVVTEHDIHNGAWYLDGGRIPTCIAVESGQADLFLSGYLGIDFVTKGLAVYRLLDAVVTFHDSLPKPGQTIRYDIRIERFFCQGDTWLFRFCFEATVNGKPLLSMRDGCAGFFSPSALEEGKGIVRPLVDPRPTKGIRPPDWKELVPLKSEGYDATQLDRLRTGDLSGCFGALFEHLNLKNPLTIPGGRMRLVHRVNYIIPDGGRYGMGMIQAEADISPDDWFITCHFVDDRVMPGTLMYECCMHTLRILLLRMGWVAETDKAVWEPVPGIASKLCCRGQVLETTKTVRYEVIIREIGYRPEPFVLADALMSADGKPIVEISDMSARLSGTTRDELEKLWSPAKSESWIKTAIYSKEQILAYSNGNPSEGFGEPYRIFDHERKIARLPGPPFQFMDRITGVLGEPFKMKAGAKAEAQFDLEPDAWFFKVERQPRMPFCVLLEAALQPCGWLAAYTGSALVIPNDISFRNLGGTAVQHRQVTPDTGTLTCNATMTKAVNSGGMIIQEFDFSVADRHGILYEGETMFGFFSKEALSQQVGIRDAQPYLPSDDEKKRGTSLPYPSSEPFPDSMLRMIDLIDLYIPDGGSAGLGYISGIKNVNPDEWFFKAHFYQDPVTPGSLGLESFLQLLKFTAVERWGWKKGDILSSIEMNSRHKWLYRGQVVPENRQVKVVAWITSVDDNKRLLTASGFLSVDGKMIYQMTDFTLRMETADEV